MGCKSAALVIGLLLLSTLAACAATSPAGRAATKPAVVGGGVSVDPDLTPLVNEAIGDLAKRLNVNREDISAVEARAVVWPDASLGCPQPGMTYTQVQQDGAIVRLKVHGREFAYHKGGSRPLFLCQSAST
jgi:hypothetical protein